MTDVVDNALIRQKPTKEEIRENLKNENGYIHSLNSSERDTQSRFEEGLPGISAEDWHIGADTKTFPEKPSDKQVGGEHYKDYPIEPGEYNQKNRIGYMEGNAIKYITRHAAKGGREDIKKAIHCLELVLEWEYGVYGGRRKGQ